MANHRLTKEDILRRFREKHGDKYTYADFEYSGINMYIDILCPEHGWFKQRISDHINGFGCVLCGRESQRRKVSTKKRYGVCVYDIDKVGKLTPMIRKAYTFWRAMTQRCYDQKFTKTHPTYVGCSVCEDWRSFSGFVDWFETNYIESYELDKDILSTDNNKIYSPDTCCFVPHEINTLINKCDGLRGNLPIGVRKARKKFAAYVRKRMIKVRVGLFDTPEEAFNAYKTEKEAYVKQVANEYYNTGRITKRVYDALMNYKIEITD